MRSPSNWSSRPTVSLKKALTSHTHGSDLLVEPSLVRRSRTRDKVLRAESIAAWSLLSVASLQVTREPPTMARTTFSSRGGMASDAFFLALKSSNWLQACRASSYFLRSMQVYNLLTQTRQLLRFCFRDYKIANSCKMQSKSLLANAVNQTKIGLQHFSFCLQLSSLTSTSAGYADAGSLLCM